MHASVTLRMRDAGPIQRWLFDAAVALGRRHRDPDAEAPGPWVRPLLALMDLLVLRSLQEHLGLRRCRLPTSGAAPIAPDLLRWFHAIGVPVREGYGMTECAGATHFNLPGHNRLGTVGQTLPPLTTTLAGDGEVLIEGPAVFSGYLHDEAATASAIDDRGRYHTGDLGHIDADGYLTITGRKKEILITAGGKNLSPEKIENALKLSPYIKEAVAIGDARPFIGALIPDRRGRRRRLGDPPRHRVHRLRGSDAPAHRGLPHRGRGPCSRRPPRPGRAGPTLPAVPQGTPPGRRGADPDPEGSPPADRPDLDPPHRGHLPLSTALQLLSAGLALGAIYALVALGFVVIYRGSQVFNFAQGEFLTIGALSMVALCHAGLPWLLSLGLAMATTGAIAATVERTVLRPLVGRPVFTTVIVTIFIGTLLRSAALILWGTDTYGMPTPWGPG